jgi:Ca2+-binding RTX toxin-like protein
VGPGDPVEFQVLDSGSVVGTFLAADIRAIAIDAGPGSNRVTVAEPPVPVFVSDSTGTTALVVDDSADPTARTVAITANSLTGLAGAISYTPDPGNGVSSLTFDPGSGGTAIDVQGTSVPTAIHSQVNDTVVVSNSGSVQGIQADLSIDNAGGCTTLLVDDSADTTARAATLTASALTGLAPAAIDYGAGICSLSITGGSGGNTFAVQGTAALSGGTTLTAGAGGDTVNVGSAANTLDPIQGAVTVHGQGGNTTLNYNDQGATPSNTYAYNVCPTSLNRQQALNNSLGPPVAPVTYAGLATLNVHTHNADSTGESFVAVGGTTPGTTTNVYGGTGPSEFIVEDINGTLNSVQGPLFLHGSGSGFPNYNILGMNDFSDQSRQSFLVTAGTSSQSGMVQRFDPASHRADMAPISYDGMNGYAQLSTANSFSASAATDATVTLRSEAADLLTTIIAGTGDSVTVGNAAHTMAGILGDVRIQAPAGQKPTVLLDDAGDTRLRTIDLATDGAEGYRLTGLLPHSSVGRGRLWLLLDPAAPVTLQTGAGNDVFRIHDVTSVPALAIDGGGGSNTLDYSAFVGNVLVDLPLGVATGLSGGIRHIENVTGSQGNDLLVGDANPNVLIGGTGRNVLIGGAGADTLNASRSRGDNLLIGGTTNWDMNLAALQAIMAEWDRTDLGFAARVSDLLHGSNRLGKTPLNQVNGQLILLTPATNPTSSNGTVHGDTSPDVLVGGLGHNWFFYDADDTLNPKTGDKTSKVR